MVSRCQPNAGHYALAAAEQQAQERGVDFRVVTQNIDRLHQAAGNSSVVEMHGSLWWVVGRRHTQQWARWGLL